MTQYIVNDFILNLRLSGPFCCSLHDFIAILSMLSQSVRAPLDERDRPVRPPSTAAAWHSPDLAGGEKTVTCRRVAIPSLPESASTLHGPSQK